MNDNFFDVIENEYEDIEELIKISSDDIENFNYDRGFAIIKPDDYLKIKLDSSVIGYTLNDNYKYKLRIIGETDVNTEHRSETAFPLYYRNIDDCIEKDENGSYLKLICNNEKYEKGFYYRINGNNITSKFLNFGVQIKVIGLKLQKNSILKLTAEIYYKALQKRYYYEEADERYRIDLTSSDKEYREFFQKILLKNDLDFIMLHFNIKEVEGKLYVRAPYISDEENNKFSTGFNFPFGGEVSSDWIGDSLSKIEWPKFQIHMNNRLIYEGEQFQRIYRWPAFEINLDNADLKEGVNYLKLKLIDSHTNTLNYNLKSMEVVKQLNQFRVLAFPRVVNYKDEFTIMIRTIVENCHVKVKIQSTAVVCEKQDYLFEKNGLNFLHFSVIEFDSNIEIQIISNNISEKIIIERVVLIENPRIITGTGDNIYINQNISDYENYLIWYFNNQIGNLITFRPVYKWSGSYYSEKELWDNIVDICKNMRIQYAHMIDGRELNGCNANPDYSWLDSEYFLGDQAHEQDGAFYYGTPNSINKSEEMFLTIFSKKMKRQGICPLKTPVYTKNGTKKYIDPYIVKDMKDGTDYFLNNIKDAVRETKRHTGPSVLFKYFYQAGANWLGAELMYGPIEIISSAIRGASKAYRKESFGAHLAMQWSTTPHDTVQHCRRYLIALFECYIQGYQQINTEEGLWRLEEGQADFERFSEACINHKRVQQFFYKFLQTHSRRGNIYVPLSALHGKYDAWLCFTRPNAWMQDGVVWEFSEMEESWDLLNIFYPKSILDAIYRYNAPNEPLGFYTDTPYGAVDILPVEASIEDFMDYKFLFMLGYNTIDAEIAYKLVEYVTNGGRLLICLPHLYMSFDRYRILNNESEIYSDSNVHELLGISSINDIKEINMDNVKTSIGILHITTAKVLEEFDGYPLVLKNNIGSGEVVFVNIAHFPSNTKTRGIYEKYLKSISSIVLETENETGWLKTSENINFTVYKHKNLKIFYLLNINWWNTDSQYENAELIWGSTIFNIPVSHTYIGILTLNECVGVYTNDNETEIISIIEKLNLVKIKIQGIGKTKINIYIKNNYTKGISLLTDDISLIKSCSNTYEIEMILNGIKEIHLRVN